jgi:hypothetical protein
MVPAAPRAYKAEKRRQLVEAFADAAIAAGMLSAPQDGDSKQLAFARWVAGVAGDCVLVAPKQTRAPKRIAVDLDRKTVTVDGAEIDVPSEQALRWVAALSRRPGCWIPSRALRRLDDELYGVRTDKLTHYLPEAVSTLIESQPGVGSRLVLPKRAQHCRRVSVDIDRTNGSIELDRMLDGANE